MKDLKDAEQEEKEKNLEKSEILLTCEMSKQEWFGILNAIAGDDTLKNLVIHNIQDNNDDDKSNNDNGFRAMTLAGTDENIIIFRGTSTNEEWIDNGQGFSNELFSMPEYQKALEMNGDKLYMIASAREPVNILYIQNSFHRKNKT